MSDSPLTDRFDQYDRHGPPNFNEYCALLDHARQLECTLRDREEALRDFRDIVLNQRGLLAENGMTGNQINDVLNELDAALPQPESQDEGGKPNAARG